MGTELLTPIASLKSQFQRDRLLGFADRWRRASAKETPTPARTLTPTGGEASDSGTAGEGNWLRRGSSPAPVQSDGERGRFQLRRTSVGKKKARTHKKGKGLTESEAEPDFPDMASMTLAPATHSAPIPTRSSATKRSNGHAHFPEGLASKPTLPQAIGNQKSNPRQAAYIAKLFADQAPSTPSSGLQRAVSDRHPGILSFPDVVAAATDAAHGGSGAVGGDAREHEKSHRERERSRSRMRHSNEDPVAFGGPTPSAILSQQSSTGLANALKQFTSVELLDGDNAFACKRCWRLANPRGEAEREKARGKARRRRLRKAQEDGVLVENADDAEEADESEESSEDDDEEEPEEEIEGSKTKNPHPSSPLSSQPSNPSSGSVPSLLSPKVSRESITAPSSSSTSASSSTDSEMRDSMLASTAPAPPNLESQVQITEVPLANLDLAADETITLKTGAAVFNAAQSMLGNVMGRASPLSPSSPSNPSPTATSPESRRPSLKEVLEPPSEDAETSPKIDEERKASIPTIQMEEPRSPPAGDFVSSSSPPMDLDSQQSSRTRAAAPFSAAGKSTLAAPVARKGALQLGSVSGSDTENSIDEGNTGTSNYDTGDETDQSGVDQIQPLSISKPTGPKRSSQSLPRRALKRYLISSAPPVLIFHFKRFQATGKGFASLGGSNFKKIDDLVSYPEYLDIAPWLAPPREEYDRNGDLKESSDPIAIEKFRKEKEREDASKSGIEKALPTAGKDALGRKHSMWHWRGKSPDPSRSSRKEEGQEEAKPRTRYRLYAVVVQ